MEYYQNLDLDKCDKEQLNLIIEKIKKNPCCISIKYKDSSTKGYHVLLTCNKRCDVCRFVFDDQKRYEIDLGKDEKFKNTVFTTKEYFRGNMQTLKLFCERCEKYGTKVNLSPRELTIDEIRIKMKIGKIQGYPYTFIYLAYNYFECPICHWFKFVKKKHIKSVKVDGHND